MQNNKCEPLTLSELEIFKARFTTEPDFKRLFELARDLPPEKVLKAVELISGITQIAKD